MVKILTLKEFGYDLLKLFLSCIGILLFLYLIRYYIPSYNGKSYYFPIHESGSEIQNNEKRIKIAKEILDQFDWKILNVQKKPSLNLSISIIAADRKNGFLTQSMAFLLAQIQTWEKVPQISICNVEKNIFDELKIFDDKLEIYSINHDNNQSYDLLNDTGRIKKEAADYWNCLMSVYGSAKNDFVLLIEDDAVPIPYVGILMQSLVAQLKSNDLEYIDYVKLFHPWWIRHFPFMFQAGSVSMAFGIMVSYFVFRRFSITYILLISVFTYPILKHPSYYEIFADTRFHITSSAYITPPESCCTQGVLFRSASIPKMLKYFEVQPAEKGHAKDHILDESPFIGKATDFNYFLHIGHFSSIRQKAVPLGNFN